MQCRAKRLHHRTTTQLQCQCSALLDRDHLAAWGKIHRHGKRNAASTNDHEHNKVVDIEAARSIVSPPTKQSTSSQLSNVESRHLPTIRTYSNFEIPFIFSHQLTATLAMEDYRYSHTYPVLERLAGQQNSTYSGGPQAASVTSKHHLHRPLSTSHLRSSSASHICHTLKPKTVTLGTDASITCGAKKARCQYCRRHQQKSLHPVECELSLKMKWYPSACGNSPYFTVQPLQPPPSSKKGHHHGNKTSSKRHAACTCGSGNVPPLYNLVRNHHDVHPFAYSCMTYFQRKAREMQQSSDVPRPQFTVAMPPQYSPVCKTTLTRTSSEVSFEEGAVPSRSVLNITNPWNQQSS